jgi:hypothetical protein
VLIAVRLFNSAPQPPLLGTPAALLSLKRGPLWAGAADHPPQPAAPPRGGLASLEGAASAGTAWRKACAALLHLCASELGGGVDGWAAALSTEEQLVLLRVLQQAGGEEEVADLCALIDVGECGPVSALPPGPPARQLPATCPQAVGRARFGFAPAPCTLPIGGLHLARLPSSAWRLARGELHCLGGYNATPAGAVPPLLRRRRLRRCSTPPFPSASGSTPPAWSASCPATPPPAATMTSPPGWGGRRRPLCAAWRRGRRPRTRRLRRQSATQPSSPQVGGRPVLPPALPAALRWPLLCFCL